MKKQRKQWKRLLALLMVLTMCVAVLPGAALAADDGDETSTEETTGSSKTLTVGSGQTYTTVQQAINAIYAEEDPTYWTIEIESGTYPQFAIPKELDGLTVCAAKNAIVTIATWTGELSGEESNFGSNGKYKYNTQGYYNASQSVYVQAENVTFEGLNFTVGTYNMALNTSSVTWYKSAITDIGGYKNGETLTTGLTVNNCTFTSAEQGYETTYPNGSANYVKGIFVTAAESWTVTGCSFDGFSSAVCFMCDNLTVSSSGITVTGNSFTSCDRAMDGYYGGTPDGTVGTLTFSDNTVTGSSALRSKIVVMDQSSKGSIGAVSVTGNTFNYTMVLMENMTESSCTVNDILEDNTFGTGSYYVEGDGWYYSGSYHGSITVNLPDAAYYEAPEGDTGYWVLNVDLDSIGSNTKGATDAVQAIIDAANAEGSHTLNITWADTDEETLLYTVTAFKDCIYWVSGAEKTSEPGMDKVIIEDDGTETDSTTAAAGDVIDFELRSTIPEDMDVQEDAAAPTLLRMAASYTMTFHDQMDEILELVEDCFEVTIIRYEIEDGNIVYVTDTDEDGNTVSTPVVAGTVTVDSDYYTVTTAGLEDGCTFEVTVDLLALYNAGEITSDDLGSAAIVVSYSATLSEDAAAGTYENTAWVAWPDDNTSEEDTVTVDTYGINIFKYDQSAIDEDGKYVGLAGATFELQRVINTTDGTVEETTDEDGNTTYTYKYTVTDENGEEASESITVYKAENKVETEDEDGNTSTSTVTYYYDISYTLASGADGYVTVEGLDAGTYYLIETKAPNGYVCSDVALEIVIPNDADKTDVESDTYNLVSVQFANSPVPSTGGTGTAMYTTVGVIILLAAGCVFLFSRKKRESD